jgi:hypothetical protein
MPLGVSNRIKCRICKRWCGHRVSAATPVLRAEAPYGGNCADCLGWEWKKRVIGLAHKYKIADLPPLPPGVLYPMPSTAEVLRRSRQSWRDRNRSPKAYADCDSPSSRICGLAMRGRPLPRRP